LAAGKIKCWVEKNIKGDQGAEVAYGILKEVNWLSLATRLANNGAHHFQKL
jgi:hypothetical protein